jgi:hypothetical protein
MRPNVRRHFCHLYAGEDELMKYLEGFVATGLRQHESVAIIATAEHRFELLRRLRLTGHDTATAVATNQLLLADAQQTLDLFMLNGWPDRDRFAEAIEPLLRKATSRGQGVRAFGEMVAILWQRQRYAATLHLERLWNELLAEHGFPLLCAYPRHPFESGDAATARQIVEAHEGNLLAA